MAKAKINFENPPLVIVHWSDAFNVAQWGDKDAVRRMLADRSWNCTNVGYLIYEDKRCVVVAARSSCADQVGLVERIPRGMVRRIDHLKVTKR
jgi:hypothetical protein